MYRRDDPLNHYRSCVLPFLREYDVETLSLELAVAAEEIMACVKQLETTSDEWAREHLIDLYWQCWTRFQTNLCEG